MRLLSTIKSELWQNLKIKLRIFTFPGSSKYWEDHYKKGGTSGEGSYGKLAEFKAEVINSFIIEHHINSVIEFGCGDGNQLSLFKVKRHIGLDVSKTAIKMCMEKFNEDKSKSFFLFNPEFFQNNGALTAELALSLDVIYHLVEEKIYRLYLKCLFEAAQRFVIVYSSNIDTQQVYHEKHRNFTKDVEKLFPEWKLIEIIKNKYFNPTFTEKYPKGYIYKPDLSVCNFYIFEKKNV